MIQLPSISLDLNRLWTDELVSAIVESKLAKFSESDELVDLRKILIHLFKYHEGPFYFLDIHTTSAFSVPFITISDSLNNRRFASKSLYASSSVLTSPLSQYLPSATRAAPAPPHFHHFHALAPTDPPGLTH